MCLLIIFFMDTLILRIYFFIIKINMFRSELSDISAITATLGAATRVDISVYRIFTDLQQPA